MKNTIKYASVTLLFFLCYSLQGQTYSNHRAVQASANWNESDLSVTLRWKWESNAQSYAIYKRVYGTESWGNTIANLDFQIPYRILNYRIQIRNSSHNQK